MNVSTEVDPENQSTCSVFHKLYPDPTNTHLWMIIFGSFYSAIFLLGTLGNISVVYVTLSNNSLQTVQNIFILNLAVADIFTCLLSVPVTPIANIYKEWYFGHLLCCLIPWVQGSSLFISTFTLTAIAIDRYKLIIHPFRPPLQRKTALLIIILIWLISGAVTIPYAYYMKLVTYPGLCGQFCDEDWPNDDLRHSFTLLYLFAQFLLPFFIISICYTRILRKLQRRINTRLSRIEERNESLMRLEPNYELNVLNTDIHDFVRSSQEGEMFVLIQRKRRTTIILGSMVMVFAITWLPYNVVAIISDRDPNVFYFGPGRNYIYLVHLGIHCFAMLSILANPVLYAWLNETYRSAIVQTLGVVVFCQEKNHP